MEITILIIENRGVVIANENNNYYVNNIQYCTQRHAWAKLANNSYLVSVCCTIGNTY